MPPDPQVRVPSSMPLNPSLAMLASLAAIALDAALRRQPFNDAPVAELAHVLNQRVGSVDSGSAAKRLLDPETTELLSAALITGAKTVEDLAREGAEMASSLQPPLAEKDEESLRQLRDFAVRLSFAAQHERSSDILLDGLPQR